MQRITSKRNTLARRNNDPLASWLAGVSRVALLGAGLLVSPAAPAVEMIHDQTDGILSVVSDSPTLAVRPRATEAIEQVAANEEPTSRVAALPANGEEVLEATAKETAQGAKPKAARFHGVTPGKSTRAELISAWGDPDRVAEARGETSGGEVLQYTLDPFEKVEALIEADTVSVVRVTLAEATTVGELTNRLRLQAIDPVSIEEPTSAQLLAVAFPEKGLTLLVKANKVTPSEATTVTHLVLEPLDSRAFVLRCEQRPNQSLTAKLADLDAALVINPADAHAHWLKATEHLAAGQAAAAENAAAESIRIDPSNSAYRLSYAEALRATGEFGKSVIETRKVLDDTSAPEIVRAGALDLMGHLAAMGDKKITAKTIDFHNAAIEIADRLATSSDIRERHLAKDLLVSSHLAVASEIARRDYADKASTVADWIGRASGFAEERITSDEGGLDLRLKVAREALQALAGMRPTKDPSPWIVEAQQTADTLLSECDDALFRSRVHWELGEAYQHAVRTEHLRGDAQQALAYGTRAIAELSSGAEPRTTSPAAERTVGQLYFYLGAVNAVHKKDHAEATSWYDKGRAILTAGGPESDFVAPRREGEELVSMGVSYWNQDRRDLAVELTETGARWMERGVEAGVLKETALAIPYGNLATMYQKLDNSVKAAEYDRRVKAVRGTEEPTPPAPRASQPVAKKSTKASMRVATRPPSTETPSTTERKGNRPARMGLGRIHLR